MIFKIPVMLGYVNLHNTISIPECMVVHLGVNIKLINAKIIRHCLSL